MTSRMQSQVLSRIEELCGCYLLAIDSVETYQEALATECHTGVQTTALEVILDSAVEYLAKLDSLLSPMAHVTSYVGYNVILLPVCTELA